MITRYRGDTHKQAINLKADGALVDLATVSTVEFAYSRCEDTVTIVCEKDPDSTSGRVFVVFLDEQVDIVGAFPYDIQVVWLDGTKTTFSRSTIRFRDDINKN